MQKYEILSAIGEGAYGVVLKCKDIQNKHFVAIKKFKDSDEEEHTKKTTMREVKILKMANHANIVEMKEAFRKKGIVYLVFEYLQNNLLEVLQKSQNGLKIPLIRKLMYQLLKGLSYLHELNIIHRDIKPENLLVSNNYKLKICDFGFARQVRTEKEEITDYVATRWYRPPELLVGGDYGKQIDLWAVACIMCQLIDGNPLFPGQNQLDQLFLIQKTLGVLPPDLHQRFIKNQRFLGMKFPEIQNYDKLDKKYFGKICQKGMSLIKSLLKLDPKERMTAAQALEHPFFEPEREQDKLATEERNEFDFRKEIYTSTTNRKKEQDYTNMMDRSTKYGKIYNKRNKNFDAVAQVYQSSNNCKLNNNLNSKSLGKAQKKMTYNQDLSLEKHYNKDILMKTEARGFYIDNADEKLSGYGELSKKSTEIGSLSSNQQLPFLLYSQQTQQPSVGEDSSRKNVNGKKKPQIIIQKQTFNIKQIINNNK